MNREVPIGTLISQSARLVRVLIISVGHYPIMFRDLASIANSGLRVAAQVASFGSAAFTQSNSIFIQTEKPAYVSGDVVRGNIYVNLSHPLHSDGIFLHLQSLERGKEMPR